MEEKDFELLPIHLQNFKKYLDKLINKDLEKYDINCMHFRPIVLLYKKKEGLSLYELTNLIGVDKANITRVINDLFKKDIVYKNDDKQRGYKIKLTDKGMLIADKINQKRKETDQKIFKNFTKEEKEIFYSLTKKCLNNMINLKGDEDEKNI